MNITNLPKKLSKGFIFPKDVQGWLSPGEGKLLFELAQLNPHLGVVVELGSYHGRSTICLAQGSKKVKGGRVFTVDTFVGDRTIGQRPDFYKQFKQNIKRYQLEEEIVAIRGDTVEVAKDWKKPIRFLFHDASHFYEDVINDFEAWERYLVPGGIIAFHDCEWPGVYKVVCRLIKSGRVKDLKTFRGQDSTGLAYAYKVSNKKSIPWSRRYKSLLEFKRIFLPKFWGRFKQEINERGESDIWFRIFGSMANFYKKLTNRM